MPEETTILVISDVHSNLQALEAVLEDAKKYQPTIKLNAGDIVGYGPQPCEVIKRVRDSGFVSVLGNHDRVALNIHDGRPPGLSINPRALTAARYTGHVLDGESADYLRSLRAVPHVDPQGRFALVHGSFDWGPEKLPEDIYILDQFRAVSALSRLVFHDYALYGSYSGHVSLGIFGHSHLPTYSSGLLQPGENSREHITQFVFEKFDSSDKSQFFSSPIIVDFSTSSHNAVADGSIAYHRKVLFNPGSVGQPRNGSPRACYGIVRLSDKTLTLEFKSVAYDVSTTQRLMTDAHLPPPLITRLASGD